MIVCHSKSENYFLQNCFKNLQKLDIEPRKMMIGLSKHITIYNKILLAKSLMIADLSKTDSIKLQENGIGKHQFFGCDIFLPQKSIDSVNAV